MSVDIVYNVSRPQREQFDQQPSSPGVDCRLAMWQSTGKEYTSNIRRRPFWPSTSGRDRHKILSSPPAANTTTPT
eukprot:7934206-Pyramimonas_sp.AAC.1